MPFWRLNVLIGAPKDQPYRELGHPTNQRGTQGDTARQVPSNFQGLPAVEKCVTYYLLFNNFEKEVHFVSFWVHYGQNGENPYKSTTDPSMCKTSASTIVCIWHPDLQILDLWAQTILTSGSYKCETSGSCKPHIDREVHNWKFTKSPVFVLCAILTTVHNLRSIDVYLNLKGHERAFISLFQTSYHVNTWISHHLSFLWTLLVWEVTGSTNVDGLAHLCCHQPPISKYINISPTWGRSKHKNSSYILGCPRYPPQLSPVITMMTWKF